MTPTKKQDTLFQNGTTGKDFQFNGQVADVFDDMLSRSIPFYESVIELTAKLLERFLTPGAKVYDLGCSTGSTLIALALRLQNEHIQFIGVDNAPAMLDKARRKKARYIDTGNISFHEADITKFEIKEPDAILCNYTLQFLRPMRRADFIANLYEALPPAGRLFISEKIISHNPQFNREMIDIYHDYKKKQGYSALEIAAKREALENVLVPFSIKENIALLKDAGFSHVETYFQYCNFVSLLAIK